MHTKELFFNEGLFQKSCPVDTPKQFDYKVSSDITLSVYLKDEWLYFKASDRAGSVNIYSEGLRIVKFKDFTHALHFDKLKGNQLPLLVDDTITFAVDFTWTSCVCAKYLQL